MALKGYAVFDGSSGSYGTFGSTISFEDGDTLSFEMMTNVDSDEDFVIFENSGGTDEIRFNYFDDFSVVIDSNRYVSTVNTQGLFDGEWHTVSIARSGTGFALTIDGSLAGTLTAVATTMDIDLIVANSPTATGDQDTSLRGDIVIGGETWSLLDDSPISSSPSATTLTFTGVQQYSVSEWEWVGDLLYLERTNNSATATTTENRNEGTRTRIVKGLPMGSTLIAQLATSEVTVSAFNADLESTLVGVNSVSGGAYVNLVCEEERFTPIHGVPFYNQIQRWVSRSFTV